MDPVIDIWRETTATGARLWVEAGQLRFRAPSGALTPELKARIQARKEELIVLLDEAKTMRFLTPLRQAGGRRAAVGVLPSMIGWGLYAHRLMSFIPESFDVHTCRLPGLRPEERALTTIEEMAAHCARQLAVADAYESWSLVGWSFGGVLAAATAQCMAAAGFPLPTIVLIDTYLPSALRIARPLDDRILAHYFLRIWDQFALADEVERGDAVVSLPDIVSLVAEKRALPREDVASMFEIFRTGILALRAYDEGSAPGRVLHIRAQGSIGWVERDRAEWRFIRTDHPRVVVAQGDHFSIMDREIRGTGELLNHELSDLSS